MLGEIRGALSLGIPPRGYALRAIFVNRESELQKLAEDLRGAVERGRGKARLVIGDAGFGKSALIEFFKDYAFEHYDVAFSYVEARKLMSSRPSELFPALYRAVLENVEDKDERPGEGAFNRGLQNPSQEVLGVGGQALLSAEAADQAQREGEVHEAWR